MIFLRKEKSNKNLYPKTESTKRQHMAQFTQHIDEAR